MTAVLVRDSSAMRTKSLRMPSAVSSSMMYVPARPPARPVAMTGWPSVLQRPRDVDALAARQPQRRVGAVARAELEVGHAHRAVEGGVEGDGDDHGTSDSTPARSRSQMLGDAGRLGGHQVAAADDVAALAHVTLPSGLARRPPGPRTSAGTTTRLAEGRGEQQRRRRAADAAR